MSDPGPIESAKQFPNTPAGKQQRWQVEIAAAKENQKAWWADGDKVVKEFLGERAEGGGKRLNLYYADVTTKGANLSGLPKVRARRRFADAADDDARVSAEMLERLLNSDIERDDDGFRKALAHARGDWLKPGLGQVRFRYVVETEKRPGTAAITRPDPVTGQEVEVAPAVPEAEVKTFEDVETDYVHWRDFLWQPCRTWDAECGWGGVRLEVTRDEAEERWGKEKAAQIQMRKRSPTDAEGLHESIKDAWNRGEVWEIWCKEDKAVYWFSEGMSEILAEQADPLGLPGFFPWPEPLAANVTTSKFMPRPSYFLAEDLYQEAHALTERIRQLVKSIKVVGGYDKTSPELKRILDEACENELVPVENWGLVKERGGLEAAVGLLPIAPQVEAVIQLVQQRNIIKQDLHEITGQSDIMRGQQAQKETATTSRIKARFGSSRIQADQDEFARFASDAQRIRAAIIASQFDAETLIKRSNMALAETIEQPAPPPAPGVPPGPPQKVPNQPLLDRAVALLKDDLAAYRIEVDAESLSMTDFDAVQQEGIAIMTASSEYFKNWAPLILGGAPPPVGIFAVEMYQNFISQFRGAQRYESTIDRFVEQMKQMAAAPKPPPPPDPGVEREKIKGAVAQQQAKVDMAEAGMEMQTATATHGMEMQKLAAETQAADVQSRIRMREAATMPVEEGEPE